MFENTIRHYPYFLDQTKWRIMKEFQKRIAIVTY